MALLGLFSVLTIIIFMPWPFMTLYAREVVRASDLAIGAVMASLYLGSVLMGLLMTRLCRVFGNKPVVIGFEIAHIVSAAVILSARSVPVLAFAFFLRGAFWSFRQVMTAIVGETLPNRALAKGYGLFAMVTWAAAAIAYPIGGWLYARDPDIPLLVSAAVMAGAVIGTILVRSAFVRAERRQQPPGLALANDPLAEAAWGQSQRQPTGDQFGESPE